MHASAISYGIHHIELYQMPGERLELSRPFGQQILSLPWLPISPPRQRHRRELHPRIGVLQTPALLLGYGAESPFEIFLAS